MIKISISRLRQTHSPAFCNDAISKGNVEGGILTLADDRYKELNRIKNLAIAARQAMLHPKPVSTEERERRLSICNDCEFLKDGKRCLKCGCFVNWKSRLEAWHCPINKW